MTTHAAADDAPASPLPRALSALDWVLAKLVVVSTAAMVIVIVVQVFLRYFLNISLDWAEEISRLFFVWSIFLAIPLGVKRGSHVGISLLTDRFPAPVQDKLFRTMNLAAMGLMAVVAYEAMILTHDQWDEPMATLDYSVGFFMLPLLIGAAHSLLHLFNGVLNGPPAKQTVSFE